MQQSPSKVKWNKLNLVLVKIDTSKNNNTPLIKYKCIRYTRVENCLTKCCGNSELASAVLILQS